MRIENRISSIGARVLSRGPLTRAYRARLATTASDVRSAQTLQFLVFNLELNEEAVTQLVASRFMPGQVVTQL